MMMIKMVMMTRMMMICFCELPSAALFSSYPDFHDTFDDDNDNENDDDGNAKIGEC